MKKLKTLYAIAFLAVLNNGFSQNLVMNPSFESYSQCPDANGQIDYATGWKTYSPSPDYFNSCSTFPYPSVPNNAGGYQYAASGEGYAGLILYGAREVLGCQLIAPLTIGTEYFLSFKTNLSFDPTTFINYGAINRIGMLFSTNEYNAVTNDTFLLNNFAHFYSANIITDTLNWTTVSGSFIADSVYNYLYLGNFFTNSQTDTLTQLQNIWGTNNKCDFSVYFFDDIYVSTDPMGINDIDKNAEIKIYPTITNSKVKISSCSEKLKRIKISNAIGEFVYEFEDRFFEHIINMSNFQEGIYFISISVDNTIYNDKIIVIK